MEADLDIICFDVSHMDIASWIPSFSYQFSWHYFIVYYRRNTLNYVSTLVLWWLHTYVVKWNISLIIDDYHIIIIINDCNFSHPTTSTSDLLAWGSSNCQQDSLRCRECWGKQETRIRLILICSRYGLSQLPRWRSTARWRYQPSKRSVAERILGFNLPIIPNKKSKVEIDSDL